MAFPFAHQPSPASSLFTQTLWAGMGLLSLFCLGCKERIEPEPLKLHQEILDYCSFAPGSYWVYEDMDNPNLLDSCYIISRDEIVVPDDANENYEQALLIWIFMDGVRNQWAASVDNWGDNLPRYVSELKHAPEVANNPHWYGDNIFFVDDNGSETLISDRAVQITLRVDSAVIGGQLYADVVKLTCSSPSEAFRIVETTWSRHVGIVQRKMVDGTTWVLKKYSVQH